MTNLEKACQRYAEYVKMTEHYEAPISYRQWVASYDDDIEELLIAAGVDPEEEWWGE